MHIRQTQEHVKTLVGMLSYVVITDAIVRHGVTGRHDARGRRVACPRFSWLRVRGIHVGTESTGPIAFSRVRLIFVRPICIRQSSRHEHRT